MSFVHGVPGFAFGKHGTNEMGDAIADGIVYDDAKKVIISFLATGCRRHQQGKGTHAWDGTGTAWSRASQKL